ncbi:MAG: hypothetical protein ACLFWM_14820 [Actinomycetota bacterium]
MTALVIIEGVVIALLVVLVAGLLRSHAEILRRLHALDGGEPTGQAEGLQVTRRAVGRAPEAVSGVTPQGDTAAVALRESRGFVLLAFLSSGCATCRPFWDELTAGAEMPAPDVRPVVVTRSPTEESPARISQMAPPSVKTIMSSEAWDAFRVPVSPYFVMVEATGGSVVGEGAAGSWQHVRDLLGAAMADAGHGGSAGTAGRARRTQQQLDAAGIRPGDASLYRNPHGDEE